MIKIFKRGENGKETESKSNQEEEEPEGGDKRGEQDQRNERSKEESGERTLRPLHPDLPFHTPRCSSWQTEVLDHAVIVSYSLGIWDTYQRKGVEGAV